MYMCIVSNAYRSGKVRIKDVSYRHGPYRRRIILAAERIVTPCLRFFFTETSSLRVCLSKDVYNDQNECQSILNF